MLRNTIKTLFFAFITTENLSRITLFSCQILRLKKAGCVKKNLFKRSVSIFIQTPIHEVLMQGMWSGCLPTSPNTSPHTTHADLRAHKVYTKLSCPNSTMVFYAVGGAGVGDTLGLQDIIMSRSIHRALFHIFTREMTMTSPHESL